MIKFLKSPLGIALTAVSALLIASPEARKTTRKLAVKGTAAVLGLVDQVKDASVGVRKQLNSVIEEAREGNSLPNSAGESHYLPDPNPLEFSINQLPIKDSFNVMNDEVLKKAYTSHPAKE
ncbi:MAG TPA: hypothetical protein VJ824_07340 [Bacillota bacterium]|nr:hypothetical protein [Bacillota bacterium]